MKICLVTAFPPSARQLNEYALHVANEMQQNPLISLTIIGDKLEVADYATDASGKKIAVDQLSELPEFSVIRVWNPGDLLNPWRILRAIQRVQPDVVWFNLVFSSFATQHDPVAAFLGLCTPALTRLAGFYTHVTLHNLIEHVEFAGTGIRHERLFRTASVLATRILTMASSISVLLPTFRKTLVTKYKADDIHFRFHGILGARPEFPDFSARGNPHHRILAIGHWGTYKRLETLMEACTEVFKQVPEAKLVVAGANHHTMPGYWESIAAKYGPHPQVEFRGYVPEEQIPELFSSSTVVVLPYNSATGASGPAHQACQYGVSLISSDIPDFVEMSEDLGMAIDFYRRGDAHDLANKMIRLLQSQERQRQTAEQNFGVALRMTMPEVIRQYLWLFERKRTTRSQRAIRRLRRVPAWAPLRSILFVPDQWDRDF